MRTPIPDLEPTPHNRHGRTNRERLERSARRNAEAAARMRALHESGRWRTWLPPLIDKLQALADRQAARLERRS